MAAAPTRQRSALLDAEGRLLAAEPRLLEVVEAAGGAIGEPLPFPALDAVARLSRRLGIGFGRKVPIADGDEDATLTVRVAPEGEGTALFVEAWAAAAAGPAHADAAIDLVAAAGGILWETDAGLRLTHVAVRGDHPDIDAAAVLGQPLGALFALVEGEDGAMPLLAAVAGQSPFRDQRAVTKRGGQAATLAGAPRFDSLGRFAGLVGRADLTDAAEPAPALIADGFGEQLDRALRRPLERIIANAGSMSAGLDGPLPETYAGYADDIAQAGRHLLGLVDDLVDLETVGRTGFAVPAEPIDLADIARRAAGLLAVRAADRGVTIVRPDGEAATPARGNFRRTLQILVNLLTNAIRYAPPGSIVTVETGDAGAAAYAYVTDEGPGIAPADQARIFEKFGRVDPEEPGGSGLGLYISRRLARAMGGDVVVESAPGAGARFTLSLPR